METNRRNGRAGPAPTGTARFDGGQPQGGADGVVWADWPKRVQDRSLVALKDDAQRALRAIEIFESAAARGRSDPRRDGDPRFHAAPRHLARVVWLVGLPDRAVPPRLDIAEAIGSARSGVAELSGWLGEMGSAVQPPLVELDGRDDPAHHPADRFLLFAHETAVAALRDLDAVLGELAAAFAPATD